MKTITERIAAIADEMKTLQDVALEAEAKPATRIFEVRGRGADGFGEEGWHTVRLCEHHCRAFFQKNEEEGFVEIRFR